MHNGCHFWQICRVYLASDFGIFSDQQCAAHFDRRNGEIENSIFIALMKTNQDKVYIEQFAKLFWFLFLHFFSGPNL